MNKKILKSPITIGIVIFIVGLAVGRYAVPTKITTKVVTKVVEVIKEVKVVDTVKSKENNTETHTIVTEFANGKKVTETFSLNKDTTFVTNRESTKKESSKDSQTLEEKITEYLKPRWSVGIKASTTTDLLDGPTYGLMLDRRILGPFFLGVQGDVSGVNKNYGAYLRMEF